MKRLVIAIDCDDVIINTSEYLVTVYNATYDTTVDMKHTYMSDNPAWGAERDEVFRRLRLIQHSAGFGRITPRRQVVQAVHQLAAQHELHLISARSEEVLDVTHQMLERYFLGCFSSVEHVGTERSKGEVCQTLHADVMVDDNIRHLVSAKEVGVDKLLWFGRYPWQNDEEWVEGIDRSETWKEVVQEIEKLAYV